ncbi:MAG: hypothetical protein ACREA9_07610 [Pyrinomonadaceae bacterium]
MKRMSFIESLAQSLLSAGLGAAMLVFGTIAYADIISGAFTVKVATQEVLPLSAQGGDMLMLAESHDINKSANFMDGAKVVNKEVDALLQGSGPQHGYATFTKGDDQVEIKWSGNVSTVMANGQPQISFQGTWEQLKGTGKYQGIEGAGTYNGHYISQTDYVVNWVGQSTVPMASK